MTGVLEEEQAEGVPNAGEKGKAGVAALEEQPQPELTAATAQTEKAAEKLLGNGADQGDVGNDPAEINTVQRSSGAKPEIGAESRATGAGDNAANVMKGTGVIAINGLADDVTKNNQSADRAGASEKAAKPKYKKRKMALFFAYIGAGYQGMQRNPGAKTIEGELEQALFKAGAITKENFGDPKKIHWMRSARTDKGVSAVGQVVSGKFIVDPPGFVERLNAHLPEKIRCFGCRRVTGSFDARTNCDRRKYEYVIPSFALDPEAYRERDYYNLKAGRKEIEDARAAASTDAEGRDANQGLGVGAEPVESKPGASQAEPMDSDRPGDEQPGTSGGVKCEIGGERVAGEENVRGEEPPAKRLKVEPGLDQGLESEPGTPGAVKLEPGLDHGLATKPGVSVGGPSNSGELAGQKSLEQEEREGVLEASLAGVERFLIPETEGEGAADGEEKKPFKYTPGVQKRLNGLLAKYTGTHNFHNFTTRVKANDGQAQRYIISFSAGGPFMIDGVEHVRLTVVGQSFMLHQIRKMVGLVLAVMRNVISEDVIDHALRKDAMFLVPVAPELGLFLEESIFGAYNKRFGYDHEELNMKSFKKQVAEFKEKYVYKHIAQTEKDEGIMATWLKTLNEKNYRNFAAANAREEEQEENGLEDEA